ncbi:hypothetical protein GCM10009616_04120 [Microlunatus lacustris]
MSAPLRCSIAVGLSVLVMAGTLSPRAASAAPSPEPTSTSSTPASRATTPASTPGSSTSYRRERGDFSLTVSPTRLAIGQQDIGSAQQVTLVNRGEVALPITVQKRNFTVGSDGALRYQEDAPYAASSWVTVSPGQFLLEPGAAQVVTATVQAPEAYEPGDHQMALIFMVPAPDSDDNVKVNRGVGLPVYITAPGPVVDAVSLSGLDAPSFVAGGTVPITATVTNSGTVHHDFRRPSPLTVSGAGTAEPFPDFTVPRGSVREIATTWDPPLLCICHPTVTMTSTDGGLQSQTVRVIVFPWPWVVGGVGVGLLLLLVVKLGRRRYAAHVAEAAAQLHPQGPRAEG